MRGIKLPFTEPRYDMINPAVHVEGSRNSQAHRLPSERVVVKGLDTKTVTVSPFLL
jgi:hypothetical protein